MRNIERTSKCVLETISVVAGGIYLMHLLIFMIIFAFEPGKCFPMTGAVV